MSSQFGRTELLFGREAMEALRGSRVAVFGLGGVGGYVVEALARSGVGALDLVDDDVVCLSNLNRQIIATHACVGRPKVEVAAERVRAINPEAAVCVHRCFFLPETADRFDFSRYHYVVDAIDTVKGKLEIVLQAKAAGVPVISCMGTGNKVNPALFRVADIYETKVCPLARVMRSELRRRGVDGLKVVYSEEEPLRPVWCGDCAEAAEVPANGGRRQVPGSTAFVPPVAGLIAAGEVVKDLIALRKGARRS